MTISSKLVMGKGPKAVVSFEKVTLKEIKQGPRVSSGLTVAFKSVLILTGTYITLGTSQYQTYQIKGLTLISISTLMIRWNSDTKDKILIKIRLYSLMINHQSLSMNPKDYQKMDQTGRLHPGN